MGGCFFADTYMLVRTLDQGYMLISSLQLINRSGFEDFMFPLPCHFGFDLAMDG